MIISTLAGGGGQRGQETPSIAVQVVSCTWTPSQGSTEGMQYSQALLSGNEPWQEAGSKVP